MTKKRIKKIELIEEVPVYVPTHSQDDWLHYIIAGSFPKGAK